MFWDYLPLLKELRSGDLLDIGLATGLIWLCIHVLRTIRTKKVGIGLLVYSGVFLLATRLELKLSVWVMQGLAIVILLVIIVIYQSEIRRLLDRFPASVFRHRMSREESSGLTALLSDALETLSEMRRGALIILPGVDPLHGVISKGISLEGRVSKALLLSIFDPNSPGHDGALVITGDHVECFGARLPLSDHDDQLKERGTRHAAALGLSERTDALVLIVSEETGRVSIAREGRLRATTELKSLHVEINSFLEQHSQPEERIGGFQKFTLWGSLECVAGLIIATTLWLILVPGTVVQTVTYELAVEVQNIPEGYSLTSVTPDKVAVTLIGEKRNFFKVDPKDLLIRLDGTLTSFGRQTYPITNSNLLLPPNLEIADLAPEQVKVSVRKLK